MNAMMHLASPLAQPRLLHGSGGRPWDEKALEEGAFASIAQTLAMCMAFFCGGRRRDSREVRDERLRI